ncbi:MAG: phosphoribosylanthranilate isomerase [Thermodesulfobacteriota bacterium]
MTKIKICGITNKEDALAATSYGADALGFIFYKKSPRCLTPETAIEIFQHLPPSVKKVGVFVNEDTDTINKISAEAELDIVQLSGDESPGYCKNLNKPYIKAFRIKDRDSLNEFNKFDTPYLLFDSYSENEYGGTGEVFDWDLIDDQNFKDKYVILSGGLNSGNVGESIEKIKPYAVDISSGVEKNPGIKDHEKLRIFIEAVKNAG